jgi:hypothetical protein
MNGMLFEEHGAVHKYFGEYLPQHYTTRTGFALFSNRLLSKAVASLVQGLALHSSL